MKVTNNSDYTVRSEAVTAIGKSGGGEKTASLLEPLLHDSIAYVRKSCVAGLGLLKVKASLPSLINALNDRHYAVRLAAYDAIVAFDTLAKASVAALLDTVTNTMTTAFAIRLAGELHVQQSVNKVIGFIGYPDPLLSGWAIWSTSRLEGKNSKSRLEQLQSTESDLFVRSLLSESLLYLDTLK